MGLLVLLFLIVAAWVAIASFNRQRRRDRLLAKFGDPAVVDKIMKGTIWQSMSQEQLVESWGRPASVDQKVMKTKTVETFKYNRTGKNRFKNRIKVENGIVVGWDQK